ncbi:phosphomannomutase family protein, partial [Mycobacterium parascrofulaceum ATCC BAA-614]
MTPGQWRRPAAPGDPGLAIAPAEWIAHDPDPATAAELAACAPDELAAR